MAVTFRKNASRDTLYALAVENGISVAEDADRAEIIAALEAFNAAEGAESAAEGAESAQDGGEASGEGSNTTAAENGAEGAENGGEADGDNADTKESTAEGESAKAEYDLFVYAGPTIPGGALKENAVFRGTIEDVTAYLADVLEKHPMAAKLIVPTSRFAAVAARVKTPGNIYHKYYSDIVSTMRGKREV